MPILHDHLPKKIFDIVIKSQNEWIDLDMKLHNIENTFFTKMKDYGPLLNHFEEVANKSNLASDKSAVKKMRELDKVKEDFNRELNERDDKDQPGVNELIHCYEAIELLEIKEKIRIEFKGKIEKLDHLAHIDEKQLGPMYKEVLEVSGDEDWQDLYS